jgi:hypothetical protein
MLGVEPRTLRIEATSLNHLAYETMYISSNGELFYLGIVAFFLKKVICFNGDNATPNVDEYLPLMRY